MALRRGARARMVVPFAVLLLYDNEGNVHSVIGANDTACWPHQATRSGDSMSVQVSGSDAASSSVKSWAVKLSHLSLL